MNYDEKLRKAEKIIEEIKAELLHIITDTEIHEYCSNRMIIPWIEEESEYAIKRLKLKEEDEKKLIIRLRNTVGVYSENIPLLRRTGKTKHTGNKKG